MARLPDAVCATLKAERAKCSTPPTNAELGAALNATAWAHRSLGYGLSRKTAGNRCPCKAGEVACDVLMLQDGSYWDVFRDVDGAAAVTCGEQTGVITDPARAWVAPVDPGPGPIPPVPPPNDLELRVTLLEASVRAQSQQLDQLAQRVSRLEARVSQLEESSGGRVRVQGTTSRAWGHSHTVDLVGEPL